MTQLLDPTVASTRVQFALAEAEVEQHVQWRAQAATFRAIDDVLREAERHPEVFVDERLVRGNDAVELAVRAATADLAVRLNLAEGTVRSQGFIARTLRRSMPRLWSYFCEGEISGQNAREAAALVVDLPPECWEAFDDQLLPAARTLAPARFRAKARAVREGVHPIALVVRKKLALDQRLVYREVDRDGMGWLHAYLPVEALSAATAHVDGLVFALLREPDETRTMNQLRADVLADLLVGSTGTSGARFAVALTIPALALLGHSDENAVLEGVGPIDIETARRLAADAPSFTRLLTEPFSQRVLQLDTTQRRPSAQLRRWLRQGQPTCDFPGCGRRSIDCDLDHTVDFAEGGATSPDNLSPRCRKHHRLKHESKWRVAKPPGAVRPIWTSPTGHVRIADPPPF